jgi:hypothetical protein
MTRINLIFTFAITLASSCSSNKICTSTGRYLRTQIDTTKEYKLKGTYCVSNVTDTLLEAGEYGIVKLNVFDRVKGSHIESGVVYFFGQDTTSIIFNNENNQKRIKTGSYIIEAWASRFDGTKTKRLTINKDKKIEINFYLGTSVVY